ncbi:MAG: penicillin-binding transpeptidase domain-containing protein, partial [Marinicellaceae bacterium]
LIRNYIQSQAEKVSAALLMVDNSDMTVKAYIGSADFLSQSRSGHVDMIQAIRSPGSTLKPFIFAMGIDQGIIHSESLLFDVPQSFNGYRPKNFTDSFHGAVSVSQALGRSLNMPAVQVLNEISPESFYAKMKNAGLSIQLPNQAKPNLTLALGGGGVKLQDLVGLFSSLGRQGQAANIRFNLNEKLQNKPLLSAGSAWIVQKILSQVSMRSMNSRALQSENSIAYKTGTSYGFRDAWVLASNKKMTLGIWVGQADGSFLENNSGRQSAVPLLQQVMAMLPKQWHEKVDKPFNVNQDTICWPLGTKINTQSEDDCHKKRVAYLLEDTAPPTINDPLSNGFSTGLISIQIDDETGKRVLPNCWDGQTTNKQVAVWPKILEPWIAKPYRRESFLPEFSEDCAIIQSTNKLEITGVHDHATLYPIASSQQMPEVQLTLQGSSGENFWFVNGKLQESSNNELILTNLKPDNYKVTVVDNSANYAEIEFEVSL